MIFPRRRLVFLAPLALLAASCGAAPEGTPSPTRTVYVTPSPSTVYVPEYVEPEAPSYFEQRQVEREAEEAADEIAREAAEEAEAQAAALAQRCQQQAAFSRAASINAYRLPDDFTPSDIEDMERQAEWSADTTFDHCMSAG